MPTWTATYIGSTTKHKDLTVTVSGRDFGRCGDKAIAWFRAQGVKDQPMAIRMVECEATTGVE